MKKKRTDLNLFLILFIPLLSLELLFRQINGQHQNYVYALRSSIYVLFMSLLLYLLNRLFQNKIMKSLTVAVLLFHSVYAFFQTGIKYYYGHFFSLRFLFEGTPDVKGYALDFLRYIKPLTYLFLLIGMISIYAYLKVSKKSMNKLDRKHLFVAVPLLIILYGFYMVSLTLGDSPHIFESSINLYKKPYYTENALNQLGMASFIPRDFRFSLFFDQSIDEEETVKTVEKEPEEKAPDLLGPRIQDDTAWLAARDKEDDATLKAIDTYFLNQPFTPLNEKTGLYEDYHFIYVLVEAFDMIAIDKDLTPTLYKMKTEGTYFDHFYSPQFNCATAESELISLTSLYPVNDTCTMSAYYDKASPQTLFNLFKDKGYETSSYHNWNDEFYPRSEIHPHLGSNKYLDVETLIPYLVSGWQSDLTMMEGIVEDLNTRDSKFMSYIITSTTHLPYDEPSELGNRYQSLVKEKYPQAPLEILTYLSKSIELDKAMAYLLENLDEIDKTVIALYADHRPLKMPAEYLDTYSQIERLNQHELDRTPMIVYTPKQKPETVSKVSGTMDMAPTFANLFNLNYDTRLFFGQDIFSEEENLVIFQSGSWYDQVGYFSSYDASFTPYDENKTHTSEDISAINEKVKRMMRVSSQIYTQDYFNQRPFLNLIKE